MEICWTVGMTLNSLPLRGFSEIGMGTMVASLHVGMLQNLSIEEVVEAKYLTKPV